MRGEKKKEGGGGFCDLFGRGERSESRVKGEKGGILPVAGTGLYGDGLRDRFFLGKKKGERRRCGQQQKKEERGCGTVDEWTCCRGARSPAYEFGGLMGRGGERGLSPRR